MSNLLVKNYNEAVKVARARRHDWESAGKPWDCPVKDAYDAACEKSMRLRRELIAMHGEGRANALAAGAIHAARGSA